MRVVWREGEKEEVSRKHSTHGRCSAAGDDGRNKVHKARSGTGEGSAHLQRYEEAPSTNT